MDWGKKLTEKTVFIIMKSYNLQIRYNNGKFVPVKTHSWGMLDQKSGQDRV